MTTNVSRTLVTKESFDKMCAVMLSAKSTKAANNHSANIGFEQKLWLAADKVRSDMDALIDLLVEELEKQRGDPIRD